jgi:hypothetical protein
MLEIGASAEAEEIILATVFQWLSWCAKSCFGWLTTCCSAQWLTALQRFTDSTYCSYCITVWWLIIVSRMMV